MLIAGFNVYRKAGGPSRYHKGIICAFAGFLALSVLNLLLVIVLGSPNSPGQSSHMKDQHSQRNVAQPVVTGTQGYGTVPATTGTNQGYGAATTMV